MSSASSKDILCLKYHLKCLFLNRLDLHTTYMASNVLGVSELHPTEISSCKIYQDEVSFYQVGLFLRLCISPPPWLNHISYPTWIVLLWLSRNWGTFDGHLDNRVRFSIGI